MIQNTTSLAPECTHLSEALMTSWAENVLSADTNIVCLSEDETSEKYDTYSHVLIFPRKTTNQSFLTEAKLKEPLFSSTEKSRELPRYQLLTTRGRELKIVLIRTDRSSDHRAGGGIEGHIDATWGGGEGIQFSAGVSVEAHDDKGNYIEANVSQNDKGEGKASLSEGYNKEEKN